MTEELLITALAKQCSNFQPASYAKLQVIIDRVSQVLPPSPLYLIYSKG